MHYRSLISTFCFVGAGLLLCEQARAADATAVCNAAISAFEAAVATGDAAKMAAVYAPDGELVSPWGVAAGHDALVKFYTPFMKAGDKQVDTPTSARMTADAALCTGSFAFTPASGTPVKGFYTKFVRKVGGEWKLLNLTFATAAPQ